MTSSSRLWELCGILGGWWAGAQDFQGVWEGPEGGRVAARSFPCPVSFHSRGGGSRRGGGPGRAARAPHDCSSGVPRAALRLDSPKSLIWWALWTRRSSRASARVASPMASCHILTGSWLVTRVERLP